MGTLPVRLYSLLSGQNLDRQGAHPTGCDSRALPIEFSVANWDDMRLRRDFQMGMPQRAAVLSPAEYLKVERAADYRSEYFRGEMFAMAGGSARHSRIKTNMIGQLHSHLKGRPCAAYDSDLRIKCPTGLYTYPDLSVVCGELEFDDEHADTVLNPTLLVEVLSKSTEAYDRGKKFDHYGRIPSLREYVLVLQDEPMVQRFLRNEDGSWNLASVSGLDQIVTFPSIGVGVLLADVYERVDFTIEDDVQRLP